MIRAEWRRTTICNGTMRGQNVRMGVPLAAWRGWHVEPERLFIQVAGITDTCAPVSSRKRRLEFVHVITSCCCCGKAEVAFIVDPHIRFSGCVGIWHDVCSLPNISLHLYRNGDGTNTYYISP